MKKIIIMCLTLHWIVLSYAQVASISNNLDEFLNTESPIIKIDPEDNWPISCFEENVIWVYYDKDTNDGYFTFYDPNTEKTNNEIFEGKEEYFFEIDLGIINVPGFKYYGQSNLKIGSFIDSSNDLPYLFKFSDNSHNIETSSFAKIKLQGTEYSVPCHPTGTLCSTYKSPSNNNYKYFNTLPEEFIEVDLSTQPCEPIPELACDFKYNLVVEPLGDDIKLNTLSIDGEGLKNIVAQNGISKIQFLVTGINKNDSESQIVDFINLEESIFDPINWEVLLEGFASFDELFYQIIVVDNQGEQLSCPLAEEIDLINSTVLCDIFTALQPTYNEESLVFSFDDPSNENYLVQLLNDLGYTVNQAETLISNELTGADFNLSYSDNGPYYQLSKYVSFYTDVNLESFEVSYDIGELTEFSGALQIEYFSANGTENSCLITPILIETEEEDTDQQLMPVLDCSSTPPDVGDMSTILKSEVSKGDNVAINGFPLVILNITSGNNENGIYGEGIIPLPFKKKQLFVNLSNIQVNEDNEVINGQAIGKNGPGINSFPNFELPPLYIGGEICVPPPVTGPLDGSGINPVTGLDGYGFDPDTGKHHLTGTEYDTDGYDVNGNHEDTNQPWNEDGCSREGILYAPDPNSDSGEMIATDEMCDPTGGTPSGLQDFIDMWEPKLDDTLIMVFEDKLNQLNEDKNAKNLECVSIKQTLLNGEDSLEEPLPFGQNNILINQGMSTYFLHEPTPLNVIGERCAKGENTEQNHIELYHCDVDFLELEKSYTKFLSFEDVLLKNIKAFIEDEIDDLKNNEFNEIQKPGKFKEWLLNAILEYIAQEANEDLGFLDNKSEYNVTPSLQNSLYYNALVSSGSGIPDKTSVLDALAFEYAQGFETVMGYPRGIVAETLRKYQLAAATENIGSLLPINIDTSFNRFDISILIGKVTFDPTSASMDVAAVVTDTENNQKIAFGGSNIALGAGAIAQENSRLMLLNDIGIRLNNAARLFLNSSNGSTYIEWDCNGFAGVQINGSIQFCREYVLPLQESNLEVIADENVLYELHFKKNFDRFFDFHFEIDAPPFELTTMRGFKWKIGAMGMDYTSSEIDNISLEIPSQYNSKYYNKETGELDNLWRGFYAKDIQLVMPKKFSPNSNTEYTAAVKNLIIDDTGLTTHVEVGADPGILPWNDGNLDGWQMSIESINLLILQNRISGGGIGGKIGIPVLKDPLKYSGTFYGKNLLFSVQPDTVCNFSPFGVKVKVFNNSYVQAEFGELGFLAKAHLNGELDFSGFESDSANIILPHLTFEGLEMMNVLTEDGSKKLRFSPGYWGVVEDNSGSTGSEQKPLISAFGISINRLSVHSNDNENGFFLKVNTSVELLKESLKATGDIELHGRLDPNESVFKMKYEGMKINSLLVEGHIKNILKLDGYVSWYDDSKTVNKFGNGFRGAISVELMKFFPGIDIAAACQFGNVDNQDYYFVDMVADVGVPIAMGPLTFNKFGGGLSKGIYPNYASVNPQPDFLSVEAFASSPLGTTISGIKYEPDPYYGHEFKLLTGFYMGKENIFSGIGELLIRMNASGSLDEVEIRAQGQFLKAFDSYDFEEIAAIKIPDIVSGIDSLLIEASMIPKPQNDAALTGFASLRFNFNKVEFVGKVAAYLDVAGSVLRGAGANGSLCMVDIYFGKQDWWIWMGEPQADRRAGLIIDLAIVEAGLKGYFDIGTKVPPFPGLPNNLSHLGENFNISESARTSTHAFAFGSSFNFELGEIISGTGAELAIGAGFDLMLRKYDDIICLNSLDDNGDPKELGINGWYAMGQAWAYIEGAIKVLGYNILSGGIATVLQLQTPNPTWGLAALEIEYSTLFVDGVWKGDIDFGKRCEFEALDPQDEFGLDIILTIDPVKNQQNVGIDQNVAVNYLFPLADTIPVFQFIDGAEGELTFEIDQDSFGLFNTHGPIPCTVIQDKHLNSTIFKPIDFLNTNDSFWTIIKVNILRNGKYYESQSKVVPFRTADELEVIHKVNIAYEYPVDGMTNFHTEQLASQQGYINLHRGQASLFFSPVYDEYNDPIPYKVKARFTSESGYSFTEDLVYDPTTFTIWYSMPSERFLPSTQYKLEIVRIVDFESEDTPIGLGKTSKDGIELGSKDKIFYTSYFRTSAYTTVTDKFYALLEKSLAKSDQQESTTRDIGVNDDYYLNYFSLGSGEVFDYYDLYSNGHGGPFIDFIVTSNIDVAELDLTYVPSWAYYEDEGFWPVDLNIKVMNGEELNGIFPFTVNNEIDYKTDLNSFNSKSFSCRNGALSYGAITSLPGKLDMKVEYNFPGHGKNLAQDIVKMPLLNLWITDFYDKVINIGSVSDYIFNENTGWDITSSIIEKIIEKNNE